MVARLEPDRHRVALLSLPRDLIVEIPGYGSARINAASVYGDLNSESGGGTELARRTVSNLLDLPIDYVVNVNFEGFVGAVDAIGGVDINVPTELYDPQYPTMDYRYMVVHFLPGLQHMDGATALIYSRVRHMDSDFQRMQRQQAVIIGLITRLRQENTLSQLQTIAKITGALRGYIQTDLPEDRMVSLAWAFHNIAPESVEHYTLDGSQVAMNVVPGDPYAEIALPGAIQGLVQKLLGAGTR
jgi:LCP family protein required for cell wall assembly